MSQEKLIHDKFEMNLRNKADKKNSNKDNKPNEKTIVHKGKTWIFQFDKLWKEIDFF